MKKLIFIIVLLAVLSCSLDNPHVNGYVRRIKYELQLLGKDIKNFRKNIKNLERYMKELEEMKNDC